MFDSKREHLGAGGSSKIPQGTRSLSVRVRVSCPCLKPAYPPPSQCDFGFHDSQAFTPKV